MAPRRLALPLLCALACSVLLPSQVLAYRQTRTCIYDEERSSLAPSTVVSCKPGENSWPVSWSGLTVSYKVSEQGTTDLAPGPDGKIAQEVVDAIREAVEVWNEPGCSAFAFSYDGLIATRGQNSKDRVNVISFLDSGWPTSSSALAITTSSMTARGELRDSDMELNSEFATFTNQPGRTGSSIDIRNTIAHEAGHMLGLDHSAVPDATMESDAPPGEISKRDLSPDDIAGLCTVYSLGATFYREPFAQETGGCCASVESPQAPKPWWLATMALGLLAAALRRRRR